MYFFDKIPSSKNIALYETSSWRLIMFNSVCQHHLFDGIYRMSEIFGQSHFNSITIIAANEARIVPKMLQLSQIGLSLS